MPSPASRVPQRDRIADEHVLGYDLTVEQSTLFQRLLLPAGIRPRQLTRIQLTEAILEMVKAGVGISVLANWAVRRFIESGELVSVPVAGGVMRRAWSGAVLRQDPVPGYIHAFVGLLAEPPIPVPAVR